MNSMDWNWFFSSLAQCGAALIGIIAAFIISKLLNESEKADSYQNQLKKLKAQYTEVRNRIGLLDICGYNARVIYTSYGLFDLIANGEFDDKTPDERLANLYLRFPHLYRHESNKAQFERFYTYAKEAIAKNSAVYFDEDTPLTNISAIRNPEIYKELNDRKIEIEKHKIEAESLMRSFQILKDEIQVKQAGLNQTLLVLYILMAGLFFTVVYPLSFLPVSQYDNIRLSLKLSDIWNHIFSLQGWMLFLLLLFVEGIFVYFIGLIYNLKSDYKTMKDGIVDDYLNLWGYSEYFGEKGDKI